MIGKHYNIFETEENYSGWYAGFPGRKLHSRVSEFEMAFKRVSG